MFNDNEQEVIQIPIYLQPVPHGHLISFNQATLNLFSLLSFGDSSQHQLVVVLLALDVCVLGLPSIFKS